MSNNITTPIFLQDEKNGKPQPWALKKSGNAKLAKSLKRLNVKGSKVKNTSLCGFTLGFKENEANDKKSLFWARFCKNPLCPVCTWRKSKKLFFQLRDILDVVQKEHTTLVPLFLTITLKNCTGDVLSLTLDEVFAGWKQLTNHRKIRRIVIGWYRTLEITYNEKTDTFHPHIHALLLVDKTYFDKTNKDYMQTTDWVQMWRTAMKLDYDPICDIRTVKKKGKMNKNVAASLEITKYVVKGNDYLIDGNDSLTDKLVDVYSKALHGRRLYAFGGLIMKIKKALNLEDPEGDLIHLADEEANLEAGSYDVFYSWRTKHSNYIRNDAITSKDDIAFAMAVAKEAEQEPEPVGVMYNGVMIDPETGEIIE